MVGLAGTSYIGKQYLVCFKSNKRYLPENTFRVTLHIVYKKYVFKIKAFLGRAIC